MVTEANRNPFTWKDYLVIGVVWAPAIIVPWIDKWQEFLVPVYVAERKTVDRDYVNLAINLRLAVACILAVLVAFSSDLLKKHYLVWRLCLGIYTGAQIYGMVIYYTGPYEAADLVYWLSSFMFIGMAVQPFVIFSQNRNAYRFRSHLVLAACELSHAVSVYVLFWVVYDRRRALFVPLGSFQILPWVAIAFFIFLIIATRVLKKYSPLGNPKNSRFRASLKALCRNIKNDRKTIKAVKFGLWASLVLPLCIPIGMHQAVYHIDLNKDGSIDFEIMTEHWYLLGRIVGLIIVETVLFGLRKLNARLSDVFSLGLPLILYLCVAIIIYNQLMEIRPLQKAATKSIEEQIEGGHIFAGPIPSKKQAVIEFYNVINSTIEVVSNYFILEGPLIPYSRMGVGLNVTATVPIKVVVLNVMEYVEEANDESGSENSTEWSKCLCVFSEINRFHSYIIHGNKTNIEMFKIHDHGKIKPDIEPVIVIMNSFMSVNQENDRVLVWEDTSEKEVGFFESYSAFPPNQSIVLHVPIGGVKITYENLDDVDDDGRNPDDTSTNVIITEPFVVYTVLITLEDGRGYVDSYEIMRVSIHKDSVTIPKIQHSGYVQTAMAIMGAAYSSLMVAFFHHFWMDSSVRLRATFMAVCLVTHRTTRRLVDANIKELEPKHALALLIVMGTLVASHLILASLFFFYFGFGYDAHDDHSKASSSSPERKTKVTFDESAEPAKPIGGL